MSRSASRCGAPRPSSIAAMATSRTSAKTGARSKRAAEGAPPAARKRVKPPAGDAAPAATPAPARRRKAGKAAAPPRKAARDGAAARRSLVIVESPTKSRTLTKFLGRGFSVVASNGHIMDLPKSELGVDLDNDFEPKYVPIGKKAAVITKIQAAAENADRIFLAPDPDREGEAIAWHLAGALRSARRPIQRLTFNEITERAVRQALENPRELDMNLVNAQQARRVLDRLVGYKVSPFVWRTVRYGLSAGRVQSVALRLICEREDEIRAFVPIEYWTIEVDYETAAGDRLTARLVRVGEEELEQGQLRGAGAGERAAGLAAELA